MGLFLKKKEALKVAECFGVGGLKDETFYGYVQQSLF